MRLSHINGFRITKQQGDLSVRIFGQLGIAYLHDFFKKIEDKVLIYIYLY
jgi:hypothetical protein